MSLIEFVLLDKLNPHSEVEGTVPVIAVHTDSKIIPSFCVLGLSLPVVIDSFVFLPFCHFFVSYAVVGLIQCEGNCFIQ